MKSRLHNGTDESEEIQGVFVPALKNNTKQVVASGEKSRKGKELVARTGIHIIYIDE